MFGGGGSAGSTVLMTRGCSTTSSDDNIPYSILPTLEDSRLHGHRILGLWFCQHGWWPNTAHGYVESYQLGSRFTLKQILDGNGESWSSLIRITAVFGATCLNCPFSSLLFKYLCLLFKCSYLFENDHYGVLRILFSWVQVTEGPEGNSSASICDVFQDSGSQTLIWGNTLSQRSTLRPPSLLAKPMESSYGNCSPFIVRN